jgi:hypothetical protein
MNVTHVVVENNKMRGVMLNDGDFSYPVCTEALLSKEIFLELVEKSGYKYYGNVSFSKPDGTPFSELPTIEFDELDERAKEDFDIPGTQMSSAELIPYTSKEIPVNGPKWRAPIQVLINTREELIKYAEEPVKPFDPEDITTYLPLNAFTNPKALFTPEEFIQSKTKKIISKLYAKENKTFPAFLKMMSVISDTPITNTYEFLDAYYSFGFIGLNSAIYSISNTHRNTYFSGATIKDVEYSFMDRRTNKYPELSREYSYTDSEETQYAKLSAIPDTKGVIMLKAAKPSYTDIKTFQLDGCIVERSMYKLRLTIKGAMSIIDIPNIKMPNLYNLPYEMYGFDKPEIKENIIRWTQAVALEQYVSSLTADKTNVSSYKACRCMSMSPTAAVYNILRTYRTTVLAGIDTQNAEETKTREYQAMSNGLKGWDEYFTTDINSVVFSDMYDIVDDIVGGVINVDNLAETTSSSCKNIGYNYYLFYNMMLKLHIPFEDIARTLLSVSPEDRDIHLKFQSPDLDIYVPFHIERKMVKQGAFNKDLYNYTARLAEKSYYWSIITKVYSEPTKDARHVAAKMLVWEHINAKKKTSFEYQVEGHIINELTSYYTSTEKHLYKDVATVIYKCAVGDYTEQGTKCSMSLKTLVTETVGARTTQKPIQITVTFDKNFVLNVANHLKVKFDGTATLSENSTTHSEPYIYFINCTVTPYWVVPKKTNIKPIYCEPISIAWGCGTDLNAATYAEAKKRGILAPDETTNSLYTALFKAPFEQRIERLLTVDSKESIITYCHNMCSKTNGELTHKNVPIHPYDILYPMYNPDAAADIPEENPKKRPYESAYEVTKAAVLARDKSGSIFDMLYTSVSTRSEEKVKRFNGYQLQELEMLSGDTLYSELSSTISGIPAVKFDNLSVIFPDGAVIPYEDLASVEGKYAVHAVTGNVILVKVNRAIYRITI